MRTCVYFPSQHWDLIWIRYVQVVAISLCEFICVSVLLCLEGLASFVSYLPLTFTFLLPLPQSPPKPRGEEFNGDIPFWTECSKLSLSARCLAVGLCIPINHRKKLLWWWLGRIWCYEHSRMLLGVISKLCSFSRTMVFGFYVHAYLVWSFWPPDSVGHGFHLRK